MCIISPSYRRLEELRGSGFISYSRMEHGDGMSVAEIEKSGRGTSKQKERQRSVVLQSVQYRHVA
jgi:hypothetical protein